MPSAQKTKPISSPDNKIQKTLSAALANAFLDGALPGENSGFDAEVCSISADFAISSGFIRQNQQTALHLESVADEHGQLHMRLAVFNDDMPFLVDSISATIASFGLNIERVIHPIIAVRRDADGRLVEILGSGESGERLESVIYMEIERADAKVRNQLEKTILDNLEDVRAAVQDWLKMQIAMGDDAEAMPDGEGVALLRWFLDRNFTQLAHEKNMRSGEQVDMLGISRSSDQKLLADTSIKTAFKWFDDGGRAPLILKSNRLSTVHRRVLIDLVILPIREGGKITGLSIHGGLWTSSALAAPPEKVPLLRAHMASLIDKFGFEASSHAGKSLAHALTALPHDILIAFTLPDLEQVVLTSMSLADRPRPKLITVPSALGRHLFAFIWLPRDEVSTGMRLAIQAMLEEKANASVLNWSISLEDGEVALLRYTLDLRSGGHKPDVESLDEHLKLMVRGWTPAVEGHLREHVEEGRAAALALRYADCFPANYRSTYAADEAARDIMRLNRLEKGGHRTARLYRLKDDQENELRLKIYHLGGSMPLSDAVPALEDFGFDVLEEVPTPLNDGKLAFIHDFLLQVRDADLVQALIKRASIVEDAITSVIEGESENDPFNQLITAAAIDPVSTIWLRSWFRYLRQTGMTYGLETTVDALRDAPNVTAALIDLFRSLHDPKFDEDRQKAADKAKKAIAAGLTKVRAIDDDRILRQFQAVIGATLRTNAFAPAADEALAFKIDSAMVPGLPAPLPWREIFVYSPRVEGIHLRSGPVARGGLRWSDRRDDFRTEILGLMKAQRVKNAVIVPTGAKGGFFAKKLPNPGVDRDAFLKEGTESYKIFIRTLLSITDNIVSGKVIHPAEVVVRDGEDPYFVVAADKGTATFSDIANEIAVDRDFWLGDAFASGGSQGYDHKAMGITARGAWVSVQRHFAEMGVDVQKEPIQVVGCGDMSGDVFGNGMLLSKALKVVAAFDHRHIFIDPDPDPAKSWKERKRLFELPRSSWDDYDKKLISKGGGVFSRSEKQITLNATIMKLLGLTENKFEPNEIISAILKSNVDLLWFGGIGTYIKARHENHVEVGDPGNDAIRIDATQVGATVIGEGANLGITQAGRVAFADCGGRINTDFIDNSAGVDCSDNEVNIKIALNKEVIEGRLQTKARNKLLRDMTDNVGALVLEDNRLQALALSIAEAGGTKALPSYVRLIEIFEEEERIDRNVEGLASSEELLRRLQEDKGLTRPELAVLISTAKLTLQDAIENSQLVEDPSMAPELLNSFPLEMQAKHKDAILAHQLRGEIIATKVANRIVNRLGLVLPFELAEEEGSSLGDIANVFIAVERLFNMDEIWSAIDDAKIEEDVRLMLFSTLVNTLRSQMAELLRTDLTNAPAGQIVERLQSDIAKLISDADDILSAEAKLQTAAQVSALVDAGASTKLAEMVANLYKIDGACGLAYLAEAKKIDVHHVATAFGELGSLLGLDWAQLTAARMEPSDPWERLLAASLAQDFQQVRFDFLYNAKSADLSKATEDWAQKQVGRINEFRKLVTRAQLAAVPSISMLAQIAGQARVLLNR